MSETNQCRWGILSTAGIARKNWMAILHAGNGRVVAVASRDGSKAARFVEECQREASFEPVPEALGSYEELLGREDIDAVYLPLPTGVRKEWVLRAARAGKHVLCEKPCAISAADLEEMLAVCRENGVQFMDGVMFMHSRRMAALRKVLDGEGGIGAPRRITAQFTFNAPPEFFEDNIRLKSDLEPQGCLGDLGWYTIRMTLWTLGYVMPEKVTARLLASVGPSESPDAVPVQFSAELFFPGGITASFYNSFETENQQLFVASGSEGYVRLDDFVLPFGGEEPGFDLFRSVFEVDGCHFVMEPKRTRITVEEAANNDPTSQEAGLFRTFGNLVLGGEPDDHWAEIALKTQRVLDACLESARGGGKEVVVK